MSLAKMQPIAFARGNAAAGAFVAQGSPDAAGDVFGLGDLFGTHQIAQVTPVQVTLFGGDQLCRCRRCPPPRLDRQVPWPNRRHLRLRLWHLVMNERHHWRAWTEFGTTFCLTRPMSIQ